MLQKTDSIAVRALVRSYFQLNKLFQIGHKPTFLFIFEDKMLGFALYCQVHKHWS